MHKTSTPDEPAAAQIVFDDFAKVDIRAGVIVSAEPFPEARKPAYRLAIDFGPAIGVKKSSAQITGRYTLEELVGCQVMAVVNFPPRQIGPVRSEVLVLGFPDQDGHIVLAAPMSAVPRGARLA
ncbi:tRNA-binding protein [Phenylobacterium sp. 58.2.17]|uniref:tRNA-binding protein n=1 Tax=Phenylobacterium sp. 58.2.17 TaxID=2969306 RepID=UPI0022651D1D|nr:tRNA-binding protein [Phenylobacterium sp. 58.2.17]MCX7586828.1 tRNA-binding protein [Phenylobacterium sp. 58.2.17]